MTRMIKLDIVCQLMAGSVRNDGKTIMSGSTAYEENPEGNGEDAGAKGSFMFDRWEE